MASILQMTSETLNALKGWPQMSAVDFEAKLNANITDRVPAGSVVSLNADLEFVLGVDSSTTNPMPMFTFFASDSPVVSNYGGNPSTTKGVWVPISPSGNMLALVAVGAYELVSTNFKTGVTYAPNSKLTSPMTASSGHVPGRLEPGTLGTNVICGVVSRGVVDNGYGHDALAFWPVFLPVYPH